VITGLTLKGADRLEATLGQAGDALANLEQASAEAGQIVTSLAAVTAPRLTGALAGSIQPEVAENGNEVTIGSDLIYAPPIHNGWAAHNIAPQPFLRDAADRSQARWVGAYMAALDRAVTGVEGA